MAAKRVTEVEVRKIRRLRSKGWSIRKIADEMERSYDFVRKYLTNDIRKFDLTGQKFGRLTVIEFDHKESGHKYYRCKCECGNEHIASACNLRSGAIKSCGCLKKETDKQGKSLDLTGQKFGKLTAIKYDHKSKGKIYWLCECECGNTHVAAVSNLTSGKTKSCGCLRESVKKTRQIKTRHNQGGVYYFQPNEIKLKGNYEVEGNKRGGEVKKYKLNPEELQAYLKSLETKEVQRRKV